MPDIVDMPRKFRVTVTVEELDPLKSTERSSSKGLLDEKALVDEVRSSFARHIVNFAGERILWVFSWLLRRFSSLW